MNRRLARMSAHLERGRGRGQCSRHRKSGWIRTCSTTRSWAIYFVVVLGIGFAARRYVKTSLDFFLSGRSLPAWITGLAFVAANLGALEILGMAANGAQYGVGRSTLLDRRGPRHGLPRPRDDAVLLRLKVRSVPEYLRLRFNKPTHLFNR